MVAAELYAPETNGDARLCGIAERKMLASRCIEIFPADLLLQDGSIQSSVSTFEYRWWLAYTQPRQEKAVAAELALRQVPFYLPLLSRKSITRGRTRMASIPLFPSYVFIFGNDVMRLSALKTNRLLSIQQVVAGDQLRMQLFQFAKLIALGVPLVRESRLVAGERVRIKSGPLRDIEGVVLRRNNKTQLLIAIDFLGQGASLEVDDCMLESM